MNWDKFLSNKRLRPSNRATLGDPRNDFESDFGRVIFSPATRRMHDKTQVFPLTADDNIHSRLTHSMEVMAIGHSLGLNLCDNEFFLSSIEKDKLTAFREIPVILKSACLVHDIGNPPFGHFGETVIQCYFETLFNNKNPNLIDFKFDLKPLEREDFEFFDGNAQGFRVLTKLQILEDIYGLNLTFATLGAYLKYPNTGIKVKNKLNLKKRGVFQSEKDFLEEISTFCGLNKGSEIIRHPLAYLMEAADSICYLVMDIEDGYNKGWYSFEDLKRKFIGNRKIFETLQSQNHYENEVSQIVNFRIALISYLVKLATTNFIKNLELIIKGEYNKELIEEDEKFVAKDLQKFTIAEIFPKKEICSLELTGHSVLTGLLDYYIGFAFHRNKEYQKRSSKLISKSLIRIACLECKVKKFEDLTDYFKLRVIVDFISGMTDQYALNHYQKLSGQKIN